MIIARGLKWSKSCFRLIIPHYFQRAHLSMLNMKKDHLDERIVWLDMEMTGIDVNTNHILEVACLITNKNLEVVSTDLNIVIHQPDEILENMTQWCIKNHTKTGLIAESRLSKTTVQDAEQIILAHLKAHVREGICPLAGSSVYMDRMFLYKYMPDVNNYLHYRLIDTSTIKELITRWDLNIPKLKKDHAHRALSDIKESIQELEYYKKHLFNL
ncbi:probable oligoribonuclease [Hylaeus anthracinus]|uniref:probable oligoribonuclease n=1 Tax=Hylaeus anthracinus TaxID=313031 RepID=UPI0023B91E15|nr:probable oligoribonuclease [Hylaeus anthracinus]